jgi:hypothetical protein
MERAVFRFTSVRLCFVQETKMKVVYKVTYPNGKIYIGSDVTDTITYVGTPSKELVAADFSREERMDFTIRKQIIWQSETATDAEMRKKEMELIREQRSNDPTVGYNRLPKHRK